MDASLVGGLRSSEAGHIFRPFIAQQGRLRMGTDDGPMLTEVNPCRALAPQFEVDIELITPDSLESCIDSLGLRPSVNIPRQSRGLYGVSRSKRLERGRRRGPDVIVAALWAATSTSATGPVACPRPPGCGCIRVSLSRRVPRSTQSILVPRNAARQNSACALRTSGPGELRSCPS